MDSDSDAQAKTRRGSKFHVEKRTGKPAPSVASRVVQVGSTPPKRRRDIRELDRMKPLREPRVREPVRGRNVFVNSLEQRPENSWGRGSSERPPLTLRERLARSPSRGGIVGFGERPPIFERSTNHHLANFLKEREAMRKGVEKREKQAEEQKAKKLAESATPPNNLQVVVTNVEGGGKSRKKSSRWDRLEEPRCEISGRTVTVDESKVVELAEPEAVLQVCVEDNYMEFDPVQEEPLQVELPVKIPDPRLVLGVARPLEAAVMSVAGAGGESGPRDVESMQPGVGLGKKRIMVDLGGGSTEVYEGYLLPDSYPVSVKVPKKCYGNCTPPGSSVTTPPQNPRAIQCVQRDELLTRAQRRNVVNKERRNRMNEMQAELNALRSKRILIDLCERAERCGVVPSREMLEFCRYLDRQLLD
jgi:hypothetical protein